jgi:protein phosphatase
MSKAEFANARSMAFESFGLTHKGCVRDRNEDRFLLEPVSGVWLVADGMGGHDAGEVASATIVEHLAAMGAARSAPDLLARFEDRMTRAHSQIRSLSQARGGAIMGSTVAALLAFDGQYACLWSGDSRVYLIRRGMITQLSRDHSEVQELLDRGVINSAEAQTWPRRNVITRAIGVSEDVEIDATQGEALPGDIFVLNTDGLTAHVSDDEIHSGAMGRTAQQTCEHLLDLVLSRGATDNVTVVVVKFHQADATAGAGHGLA